MNLYHISQTQASGCDTYSDAVVAAESEDAARRTHPCRCPSIYVVDDKGFFRLQRADGGLCAVDKAFADWAWDTRAVKVRLLGVAAPGVEAGVICASYHAG